MDVERRIVITGVGAVTCVGIGRDAMFKNLLAGKSGIDTIKTYDASNQTTRIAGEVKDFDPMDYLDRKLVRRIGRYAQFGLVAAQEALDQSGLDLAKEDSYRIASTVSSAIADYPMIEEAVRGYIAHGPGKMSPFTVPRVITSMASAIIDIQYKLNGPSFGQSSACATGNHSLASAAMLLQTEYADMAFAGGVEAAIAPTSVESYIALRGLSSRNDEPQRASRPFDRDRDGFIIAEGAAILILETLEHAQKRGAHILAELAGAGMSCDGYHFTASHPEGKGAAAAMRQALDRAGIDSTKIDYINAHGTSTIINDVTETIAIKAVFADNAYKIPISSIKSMIGHSLGASGAIEAAACVMALNENAIPPTINLENPDPECDLDYVPNEAREKKLDYVMSNSFGFGGQNCVLIFKKV